jgi:hypothetical protein
VGGVGWGDESNLGLPPWGLYPLSSHRPIRPGRMKSFNRQSLQGEGDTEWRKGHNYTRQKLIFHKEINRVRLTALSHAPHSLFSIDKGPVRDFSKPIDWVLQYIWSTAHWIFIFEIQIIETRQHISILILITIEDSLS